MTSRATPVAITVPVGATASRPTWDALPPAVRAAVEDALGGRVVHAVSQGSGFTPGFASRLRLADGRRAFVKGTGDDHAWLAADYRNGIDKLALLPAAVPAPRLRTELSVPTGGPTWLLLVFDDVDGRPPARPWELAEARSVLAAAHETARALTPAPTGRPWTALGDEAVSTDVLTAAVGRRRPELLDRVAPLLAAAPGQLHGTTLVHSDLRDDNVIVDREGRVWFCDWNFPVLGPVWTDAASLAVSMSGDGLPADALLAETGLLTAAEADGLDAFLAFLLGYFCLTAAEPPPDSSPYLRTHQAWYAEAVAGWLTARRGW